MKKLLVLFLLIGTTQFVGAQTDKFERKVNKCLKTGKEMVFIYDIPKQDFQAGEYTVKLDTTKVGCNEYTVVQDHHGPVAKVRVYDSNIVKLEQIILLPSFRVTP